MISYIATQGHYNKSVSNKPTRPSVSDQHHLNDTFLFRQKSHPRRLNWRGPVFHIRGALQHSRACMCVCLFVRACLSVCGRACARSYFCIVSVVWYVRGTQAHSGESIWDIYYALHQSFWTLDISLAEQIVSYQNSISEMTCWNSLPQPCLDPSPPAPLHTLPLPYFLACSALHLTAQYFPNKFTHTYIITHMHAGILERTNEVQSSPPSPHPPTPHHLSPSPKQLTEGSFVCKELTAVGVNRSWATGVPVKR